MVALDAAAPRLRCAAWRSECDSRRVLACMLGRAPPLTPRPPRLALPTPAGARRRASCSSWPRSWARRLCSSRCCPLAPAWKRLMSMGTRGPRCCMLPAPAMSTSCARCWRRVAAVGCWCQPYCFLTAGGLVSAAPGCAACWYLRCRGLRSCSFGPLLRRLHHVCHLLILAHGPCFLPLQAGASPDQQDVRGQSALIVAVLADRAAVAEVLLAAGADPNRAGARPPLACRRMALGQSICDRLGRLPSAAACHATLPCCKTACLQRLPPTAAAQHRVLLPAADSFGATPIWYCGQFNALDCIPGGWCCCDVLPVVHDCRLP